MERCFSAGPMSVRRKPPHWPLVGAILHLNSCTTGRSAPHNGPTLGDDQRRVAPPGVKLDGALDVEGGGGLQVAVAAVIFQVARLVDDVLRGDLPGFAQVHQRLRNEAIGAALDLLRYLAALHEFVEQETDRRRQRAVALVLLHEGK